MTAPLPADENWRTRAACRGHDTDLWFAGDRGPGRPGPKPRLDNRHALAICNICPVREPCLRFALTTEKPTERWGIYGGLTPEQRARIRRAM